MTVRLTVDEAKEMDRVAHETGQTRSAVVRAAVEAHVSTKRKPAKNQKTSQKGNKL